MSRFALAALVLSSAALAAEGDPLPTIPVGPPVAAAPMPAPVELEPVSVTATRTTRPVSAVPASVSVVDAFAIEQQGATSLGQAVKDLPGVAVEGGPRRDAEFINIRGLSGPRVMLLVDGARQNFYSGHRSSLLLEPELIKRIELLRGPASALWGSDALGGVVSVTTRDAADFLEPGERFAGRARVGFDSVSTGRLASTLGAARLGDFDFVGDLAWRTAGDYRLGSGEREPDSAIDSLGSLGRLSWLPEGDHRFGLDWQGYGEDGLSPSNPSKPVADDNPLLARRNDQRYLGGRYAFEPEAGGLLERAAFNVYRSGLTIREDRVEAPRRDVTDFTTRGFGGQSSLRLPGEMLATLGGEWFRDRADATRDGAPRPQFPDAQREVGGAFGQLEIPLGPVSLVPGVRLDRYRAQSGADVARPVDASALSPKLGLVWEAPGPGDLRLRLSQADGFRAPSLVELYSSGQHFLGNEFVPNPDLRPERARSVEAGASWSLGAGPGDLELNASVYRNRIRDFIELDVAANADLVAPQCASPTPAVGCINRADDGSASPGVPPFFVGGTTTSRNLTDATLQGGELAAVYRVGPAKLSASFSRVRGRDENTGEWLSSIPADTLRGGLAWSLPFALRASIGATHALAQNRVPTRGPGSVTITPSTPFDDMLLQRFEVVAPSATEPTPAYTALDLSLAWTPVDAFGLREPRLTLGIDNLADADYREHLSSLSSPGRNIRLGLSSAF